MRRTGFIHELFVSKTRMSEVREGFWHKQRVNKTPYKALSMSWQGSKLTLANSQNASAFDNLRVRKIATSKRLRVRIIHVYQTFGKNLLVISPVCQQEKILLAKLCKWTKKLTSSLVMSCLPGGGGGGGGVGHSLIWAIRGRAAW